MRWLLIGLIVLAGCATGQVVYDPPPQLVRCADVIDAIEDACPALADAFIVYKTREDIQHIYEQRQDIGQLADGFTGSCLLAHSAQLPEVAGELLLQDYGASAIPPIIIEITPDLYGVYRDLTGHLELPPKALSTTMITVDFYESETAAAAAFSAISGLPTGSAMVNEIDEPFAIPGIQTRQELHVARSILLGGVQISALDGDYFCNRAQIAGMVEALS